MLFSIKKAISFILIFCFIINPSSAFAASIQDTDYIISKCEEISQPQLRVDLNRILEKFIADETNIDFGAIVNRQWQHLNIDSVIDNEINLAVDAVSDNTNLVNKFKSSWSPSKTEKLTNQVTEIAFNSPGLKNKFNQVSQNVASEISDQLELASAKSSSYAIDCLQSFVNKQYSQTFVDIFSKKINASVPTAQESNASLKPSTELINHHQFGFAGGTILVLSVTSRRIAKTIGTRIFSQIGERILGRIGSAVIPFVGETVGALMIANDIYQSLDGALPEIQKSLKSPEVKQIFKEKITNTVKEQIRAETPQIARELSNDIYAKWLDFKKDYRETLSLAEELPEFQSILAKTTDLYKISLLLDTTLNNTGRNQLVTSIQDGTFEQVLSLPEISYKILKNSHSLPVMVDWANLAGNKIKDVVELEIYKNLSPQDLERQLLMDIISLQDNMAIAKISLLDIDSIRELLTISKHNLLALTNKLTADDLQHLAKYLRELNQPQINQLVKLLLNSNTSIVRNSDVMTDIVHSSDMNAAIKFWETPRNQISIFNGIFKVLTGTISWHLFTNKYGISLAVMFMIIFLIAVSSIMLYLQLQKYLKPKNVEVNQ